MSFIGSALGVTNGYVAPSGAGPYSETQQQNDNQYLNTTEGQQTTLAQQLLAQSNGQGPNIANLQLQQATGNNNKQAAGAVASQRGMNPAIAQRLIDQNTAAANQNAAGQSATLKAQQQLAAQGALANVYGQQAGEAATNYNTLAQAQTAATTTNAATAQSNQGLFGSIFAHGGEVKALPKHLQHLSVKTGDKIHPVHLAQGGSLIGGGFSNQLMGLVKGLWQNQMAPPTAAQNASSFNNNLNGTDTNWGADASTLPGGLGSDASGMGGMAGGAADATASEAGTAAAATETGEGADSLLELAAAHGGAIPKKVDAMVSPGERYIPPHLVEKVRSGKLKASQVAPKFPGKPKVQGDSEQNDTIATKLAPGGVVIKRSKADNDADAREFLQEIAKEKARSTGPSGYAKVLQKRRQSA